MNAVGPHKRTVRITLLGETYTLLTSDDEAGIQELADSVNHLMTMIAARSPQADRLRVAVLACLHLADRLRSLENELAALKRRVDEKSRAFSLLLEEALQKES